MSNVLNYWEDRFLNNPQHHSNQNYLISQDFINHVKLHYNFIICLKNCKSLIEIGCGTGELCYLIRKNFLNIDNILGVDISTHAIEFANNHYKDSTLFYKTLSKMPY